MGEHIIKAQTIITSREVKITGDIFTVEGFKLPPAPHMISIETCDLI